MPPHPIDVKAGCPDKPLRGPDEFPAASPESVIDDFEDGDLSVTKSDNRTGSWYSFPVVSPGTTGLASSKCAARGKLSGHFIATAGDGGTGANWNASNVDPFTDVRPSASAWGGFSFWIAAGDADSVGDMTVGINTPGVVAGGMCMPCGDYHRTVIQLTRSWTRVSLRFEDLMQMGFGEPKFPLLPKESRS